jgi:hypothetical protein
MRSHALDGSLGCTEGLPLLSSNAMALGLASGLAALLGGGATAATMLSRRQQKPTPNTALASLGWVRALEGEAEAVLAPGQMLRENPLAQALEIDEDHLVGSLQRALRNTFSFLLPSRHSQSSHEALHPNPLTSSRPWNRLGRSRRCGATLTRSGGSSMRL